MKNIKIQLFSSLALFFLMLVFVAPIYAQEGGSYDFQEQSGLKSAADAAGFETENPATIDDFISQAIFMLLSFVGVIFIILIIYGGVTYMTAHGNEEKVKKAMGIIMNGLIGLIVTLASYSVAYFILNNLWKN
jgi:hypothetical protein